jgi:uncharacterized protein YktB (UPF0637 family)
MSKLINSLVAEIVATDMKFVSKMKKSEVLEITKRLLEDNIREMTDDTIIKMYEEQFDTQIAVV